MSSGTITRKIKTEIRHTLEGLNRIHSVWGFGSFFRQKKFNDIDVLVIVTYPEKNPSPIVLLSDSQEIRALLYVIETRIGIRIDPLVLTINEFESRPLRDMDELVYIL